MKRDRRDGKIWGKFEGSVSPFLVPSFSIHSSFSNASTISNVYRYKTNRGRKIAARNIVVANNENWQRAYPNLPPRAAPCRWRHMEYNIHHQHVKAEVANFHGVGNIM